MEFAATRGWINPVFATKISNFLPFWHTLWQQKSGVSVPSNSNELYCHSGELQFPERLPLYDRLLRAACDCLVGEGCKRTAPGAFFFNLCFWEVQKAHSHPFALEAAWKGDINLRETISTMRGIPRGPLKPSSLEHVTESQALVFSVTWFIFSFQIFAV